MRVQDFAFEQLKAELSRMPLQPSLVCYAEGYKDGVDDLLREQKEDAENINTEFKKGKKT